MNIDQIVSLAKSREVKARCAELIYKLKPNFWHWSYLNHLIPACHQGSDWFNLLTVLSAISEIEKPGIYLEVGVHKGGSLVQVITQSPKTKAVCFDMWPLDYAVVIGWDHIPSSPAFIVEEMGKFVPGFYPTFYSGDSQSTLPKFFSENHDFMADLALVDGDHSEAGARRDLEQVWPHCKIIVFDDINHPVHPYLEMVWDEMLEKHGKGWISFKDHYGVGTAVAFKP